MPARQSQEPVESMGNEVTCARSAVAVGTGDGTATENTDIIQALAMPPPPPSTWLTARSWEPPQPEPVPAVAPCREWSTAIVERVRVGLERSHGSIACVEAKHSPNGWTINAYVAFPALKERRAAFMALAQEVVRHSTDAAPEVFLIGFAASPFTPMPMGFGVALALMPERSKACWESYSLGFCEPPSTCLKDHPKVRVGIQICLRAARVPRVYKL